MKFRLIAISFLASLVFFSCLEPYEFDSKELPDVLVVDGTFTSQHDPHYVTLRKVSPYGEGPGEAVPFADLRLLNDLGEIGYYQEKEAGVYALSPTQMTGEPGRTYTLEITLVDGRVLLSKPQKMLARIEADSAYHQFDKSDLRIFVDTPVPTDEDVFFRWSHDQVFSFVTQPCNPFGTVFTCYVYIDPIAQQFYTGSNRGLDIDHLLAKQILFDPDLSAKPIEFKNSHYYNVYQRRIDEDAYNYWNQINQTLNQQGTIFDPVPATVRGNMYFQEDVEELVLGYFEVSNIDTVRTFVTNSEVDDNVNGFRNYCPAINSYSDYLFLIYTSNPPPDECCSCGLFDNQIERPDYF
ncbi:MAG: DUF4249 domain-containing protein [Saprospiraceae bacterium]|nr:DUF4249 domain-containing protein [Saprospiraceae bacterium]